MRGRGTSEGVFRFGEHDAADGARAIDWCASLEGVTGDVGMYGFSYQGSNQLMAARHAGPALKALAPAMFSWNVREHWAFENNAFRLSGNLGWAIQIAAETARHAGDSGAFAELYAAARGIPLNSEVTCRPDLMERHKGLSHYHDWLDTPAGSEYWERVSPSAGLADIAARNLPALVIGGWYDSHLRGTLDGYRDLVTASAAPVRLVVGPWVHFPWDRRVGAVDFGPGAASRMDELQIRWFDHWLKGRDTGLLREPPVQLFDIGARCWRSFPSLPREPACFALAGTGAASIDSEAGKLLPAEIAPAPGVEYFVHDPWRPTPSMGGTFGSPPGPADRYTIDARGDVLTFTTAPFDQPRSFAGDASVTLHVVSDAPDFDIACVLSMVPGNGQVIPVADGYRRVRPGENDGPVTVPLGAACVTLRAGAALRLSISGAAFPAFPVNPGTGEDPTTTPLARARVTTTGIRFGAGQQSILRLSVAD